MQFSIMKPTTAHGPALHVVSRMASLDATNVLMWGYGAETVVSMLIGIIHFTVFNSGMVFALSELTSTHLAL